MSTDFGPVPWNRKSEIFLLELVKERVSLWDPRHPLFVKTSKRRAEFKAVAESLRQKFPELKGLDAESARKKFRNIKTYFVLLHKKIQQGSSDLDGNSDVKWDLYHHASFMTEMAEYLESLPSHMKREAQDDDTLTLKKRKKDSEYSLIPWIHESEICLLEQVRERDLLWDPRHPLYAKTTRRKAEFTQVAETLRRNFPELKDVTAESCRKKLKNVKTYFAKQYKKLQQGLISLEDIKWELFPYATFMSDSVDYLEELQASSASPTPDEAPASIPVTNCFSKDKAPASIPVTDKNQEENSSFKMIPWTRESEMCLLDSVKEKESLWNPRHPLFSKHGNRKAEFEQVAETLRRNFPELQHVDADCARKKFKNLKTYFLFQHNRIQMGLCGLAQLPDVKWELFKHASFLTDSAKKPESQTKGTVPAKWTTPTEIKLSTPQTLPSITIEPCDIILWEGNMDSDVSPVINIQNLDDTPSSKEVLPQPSSPHDMEDGSSSEEVLLQSPAPHSREGSPVSIKVVPHSPSPNDMEERPPSADIFPQSPVLPNVEDGQSFEAVRSQSPSPHNVDVGPSPENIPPQSPSPPNRDDRPLSEEVLPQSPTLESSSAVESKRCTPSPQENSEETEAIDALGIKVASLNPSSTQEQSPSGFARGLGQMVEDAMSMLPRHKQCKFAIQVLQVIEKLNTED